MLTIKDIIDAWKKVYNEDLSIGYYGFITELEKIIAQKKEKEKK